ncbi:hypothetical protein [Nostoc sp.]|uniref:hypothetical protein n=1 Tax=Nostoc sp. TaxID=1180 RepID=UPI002FF71CF7
MIQPSNGLLPKGRSPQPRIITVLKTWAATPDRISTILLAKMAFKMAIAMARSQLNAKWAVRNRFYTKLYPPFLRNATRTWVSTRGLSPLFSVSQKEADFACVAAGNSIRQGLS